MEYSPLINKIKVKLLEQSKTYADISFEIKESEERVRQALIGKKPDHIVISELCKVLDIKDDVNVDDYIADYDFRQKKIAHKKGGKAQADKEEFIREFKESYSKETIDKYINTFETEDDWVEESEETIARFNNKKKQDIFKKLLHIYQEFPEMVEAFCNEFVYSEFFINKYTSAPSPKLRMAEEFGVLEITSINDAFVTGSLSVNFEQRYTKEFVNLPVIDERFTVHFDYKDCDYDIKFKLSADSGYPKLKAKGFNFGNNNVFEMFT